VPTLVLAPHPDDETLAAGGLIAYLCSRHVPVTVVAVTDGEHAYMETSAAIDLADIREREQVAALACLGVFPDPPPEQGHGRASRQANQVLRLRLTDSGVAAHQQSLIESLLPLVSGEAHLLAPWEGDFHPDHEACGRAANLVAKNKGAQLTSFFFWTWHRGTPATLAGLPLVRFPLNEFEQTAKLSALACHRSQLAHPTDPAGSAILPDDLLDPARRTYEVFLPR